MESESERRGARLPAEKGNAGKVPQDDGPAVLHRVSARKHRRRALEELGMEPSPCQAEEIQLNSVPAVPTLFRAAPRRGARRALNAGSGRRLGRESHGQTRAQGSRFKCRKEHLLVHGGAHIGSCSGHGWENQELLLPVALVIQSSSAPPIEACR